MPFRQSLNPQLDESCRGEWMLGASPVGGYETRIRATGDAPHTTLSMESTIYNH